jgi:hypothetical protein
MADTAMMARQGRSYVGKGAYENLRIETDRSLATFTAHPEYYDTVIRGATFTAGTAASGVAPGTSIGTTAAFTLYNPVGSGVNVVVLQTTMSFISGTLGAGTVHYVVNNNPAAAAVTGTAITPINNLLGGAVSQARAFTTATLPASPTILRPFTSLTAITTSTAVQLYQVIEDVRGSIIITPGCALSLEATAAAGTSPLVCYGMTWEEFSTQV